MSKLLFSTLTILFLFTNNFSFAQQGRGQGQGGERPAIGILKGKVLDKASSEAVEYATISLHSMRDSSLVTGGITNNKGEFYISEIKLGGYFVKIGFLGYDTKIITNIKLSPRGGGVEQNLGDIVLEPSSQELDEVDIVAEKMIVTNAIDKKIFNVSQSFAANISSASEILENIPSIDVDIDGNISLRGSENVKILIDGKPSGLSSADLMEQIPASSIESIEVITNPSAKYDPDGMSGIINVVLKKNKLKGFNGMLSASLGTGNKYNTSAQLSYRNKKINIYGNYSMRAMERGMSSLSFRETNFNDVLSVLEQSSEGAMDFFSQMGKAGIDYSFNERNTISFSGLYSIREHNFRSTNYNDYLDENRLLASSSDRTSTSENGGDGYDFNFNYLKKFYKKGHELSFDINRSIHESENTGVYVENFKTIGSSVVENDSLENDYGSGVREYLTAQIDYTLPISENSKFEAGVKYRDSDMDTKYSIEAFDYNANDFIFNDDLGDDFNYNEKIYSGYAIYGQKLGVFSYQIGLRAEQTATDFTLLSTNDHFENDYFSFYPSAHIQYEKKEGETFQLSYSKRVNRPHSRALNPRVRRSDPLNLRAGNPYLSPEYIGSVELGYMKYWEKMSITSAVYYREITDMITRIKTVDTDGISMTTYENIASGSNYGIEFVFNGSPYKWWNFTLSSNIYRSVIDGSNLEVDMNNEGTIFSTKLMSTWKIPKIFDVQVAGRYRGPRMILQGDIDPMYTVDISIKKQFLNKRANFSLRLSDVFDTREFNYTTLDTDYYQESTRKRESRYLYASLSYRFGKLSPPKKRKKGSGSSEGGDDMEID